MHPFGGTPICPRCSKAVYAAEQVMGPGRKLYHKPCLACTMCSKRLDSLSLLEHDQQPYCKSCHVKHFGTRDLRQGNLPMRDESSTSENPIPAAFPISPIKTTFSTPPRVPSPVRAYGTGNGNGRAPPLLRPNRSLAATPTTSSFPSSATDNPPQLDEPDLQSEERDVVPTESASPFPAPRPVTLSYTGTPTNTGRPGFGGIPRTVPLSPTRASYTESPRPRHQTSQSVGSIPSTPPPMAGANIFANGAPGKNGVTASLTEESLRPLVQTSTGTGTRYGAALGGRMGMNLTGSNSPPKKWGGGTPVCPRCGKSVFFAEQVKAVGKTYHKGCLRCTECSTMLDSSRLRDHGGEPICVRCYSKLHGPEGGGYALMGKAGG